MEIRFEFTRAHWLPSEWPALVFWPAISLTILTIILVAALGGLPCSLLLLPLAWICGGRTAFAVVGMVVRGREEVTLLLQDGSPLGISSDRGRTWQPALDPGLEDRGECWLLWTPGGIRLPIPKAALGEAETEALLCRFPR